MVSFFFNVHPYLGKISNLTNWYFSKGLKPPTRWPSQKVSDLQRSGINFGHGWKNHLVWILFFRCLQQPHLLFHEVLKSGLMHIYIVDIWKVWLVGKPLQWDVEGLIFETPPFLKKSLVPAYKKLKKQPMANEQPLSTTDFLLPFKKTTSNRRHKNSNPSRGLFYKSTTQPGIVFFLVLPISSRWWFQIFFISPLIWGRFPFWPICFKGGETTNQSWICFLGVDFF